jgi:hypothetical protein
VKKRNAYRILVGKPEGKRPLGRPKHRCMNNVKMNVGERGWDGIDQDHLCGLMVRVLGYRSGGPGSIPGTTRFSGGQKERERGNCSGSGMGSTQPHEYN